MSTSKNETLTPYLIVIVLTSLAILLAQVSFTRLLCYRFYYHYVFFVVSLAQLGLGAAGSLLYWKRDWKGEPRLIIRCLIAMSLLAVGTLTVYSVFSPAPNLGFAKSDPKTSLPYLLTLSVMLVAFNLAAGLVLTLIFTRFRDRIGRLYAADLLGAACGCAASVALMWLIGPPRAFLFSAALAAGGALVLWSWNLPSVTRHRSLLEGCTVGVVLVYVCASFFVPQLHDPNLPHSVSSKILRYEWNHMARVDAPRQSYYVIDGGASTDALHNESQRLSFPEYEITGPQPKVAILGVGAGPDLKAAVSHKASSILAIDINSTILRWDKNEDATINGDVFNRPEVTVQQGEGRHSLRSTDRKFDLVVMYAIDTYTASAQGAYSLTENFLYTSEAIQDYLSCLEPDGIMAIRRWMFDPPREVLRAFTTVIEGLENEGVVDAHRHIVVLAPDGVNWGPKMGYLMFSRSPFTEDRLKKLDFYVSKNNLNYLFRPGLEMETPYSQYANSTDREAFLSEYPYVVSPAHDENPFFFLFMPRWRFSQLPRHFRGLYADSSFMLLVCLGTVLVLTSILLGVPLWIRRRELAQETGLLNSFLYFSAIGVGFMAVELVGVQTMTLFLGHPTYALSVVLMGMLGAAGLGSFIMQRMQVGRADIALVLIILLTVASSFFLLPMIHFFIDQPFGLRLTVTFLWLLAVATPLGMPFVGGVRTLGGRPHAVAWAWACNGAASVIGSCVVMMVMVYVGSRHAILLASFAYCLALATRRRLSHGKIVGTETLSIVES